MKLLHVVTTCWYMTLLHVYYKNVEHGTEHDVDSAYGVCIR